LIDLNLPCVGEDSVCRDRAPFRQTPRNNLPFVMSGALRIKRPGAEAASTAASLKSRPFVLALSIIHRRVMLESWAYE
jgi:hypothetical protein